MGKKTRKLAVKLAAKAARLRTDQPPCPLLWSLSVFFETYIDKGAKATAKDFGPKKPVKLKKVK